MLKKPSKSTLDQLNLNLLPGVSFQSIKLVQATVSTDVAFFSHLLPLSLAPKPGESETLRSSKLSRLGSFSDLHSKYDRMVLPIAEQHVFYCEAL